MSGTLLMDYIFNFKQISVTTCNSVHTDKTLTMFCKSDFKNLFLDFRGSRKAFPDPPEAAGLSPHTSFFWLYAMCFRSCLLLRRR